MKKVIDIQPKNMDVVLLIARIGIAGFMLTHGLPKLGMLFSDEPVMFPGILGMSPVLSLSLAVFAEVVCSILVLLGVVTRFAVIPLITTMLVAVFYFHLNDPFTSQEPGLLYLVVYMMLLVAGSGRYSIDRLLLSKASK